MEYPINRYAMETKRQLHVLDTHLADHEYMAGDQYTIADMAIWPWYGGLLLDAYDAQQFLSVEEYRNLKRWTALVGARPAVGRGRMVNRTLGPPESRLRERHCATDFDTSAEGQDVID
jgi:GST-like protein